MMAETEGRPCVRGRPFHDVDLVTFDVFDTMVTRVVGVPTDAFEVMAAGAGLGPAFASERVEAELLARKAAGAEGREEIRLEEIYELMGAKGQLHGMTVAQASAFEIETEVRLCRPRPDIRAMVEACIASGARVLAVSDMYLPGDAVRRILEGCGYEGLAGVEVSSEHLATKHTGNLFARLAERERVKPWRWVHVGDNPRADVSVPRSMGIRTLSTPLPQPAQPWRRSVGGVLDGAYSRLGMLSDMSNAGDCDASRFWGSVGTEVAAPLVVGFCHAVRDRALSIGADRICFLARDGALIKTAYETLFPEEAPRSRYLYASRRAVNFAAVREMDAATSSFLSEGRETLGLRHLLGRIGLDDDASLSKALAECPPGFDPDALGPARKDLVAAFEALGEEILTKASREREVFVDYLRSEGLLAGGTTLLVDVGWRCTIQRGIAELVAGAGGTGRIEGIYVGTKRAAHLGGRHGAVRGWLFQGGRPRGTARRVDRCVEFVELMFSAPEHGIVGVAHDGGAFAPVRIAPPEEEPRIEVARHIHAAVGRTCSLLAETGLAHFAREDGTVALRRLDDFLRRPDLDAAHHVGALGHAMGFGASTYAPFVRTPANWRSPVAVARAIGRSFWKEAVVAQAPSKLRPAALALSPAVIAAIAGYGVARVAAGLALRRLAAARRMAAGLLARGAGMPIPGLPLARLPSKQGQGGAG